MAEVSGLKATKGFLKAGYSLLLFAPSWFQEALKPTLTLLPFSPAISNFANHFQTPIHASAWLSWPTTIFVGAKDRALWCGNIQGLCAGVAGIFEGSLSRSSIKISVQTPATRA